jgi:DMSO/TMAO reductase YedYZ molybdopterin-dependent catalytic subunit
MDPTKEGTEPLAPEPGERATARIIVKADPLNAEASPTTLAATITPIAGHYVRAHFPTPHMDARSHRIAVLGGVARPRSFAPDELRRFATRTVTTTLECAGNGRLGMVPLPPGEPWAEGAVSTAVWSGAPLADLLAEVGLRDDTVEILVEGADMGWPEGSPAPCRFARALPLDKALDRDVLLAWEMNGQPLPVEHGAPVRLIVPGWYGMASVKWVARIVALSEPFTGWLQSERYVYVPAKGSPRPVTTMRVRSLIVAPTAGARLPRGVVRVSGWAWSGHGAIARVEVALDESWTAARLAAPPTPHAWTRFALDLDVTAAGRHTLRARATDAAGHVQPDVTEWNAYGYGNNAVVTVPFSID